jgi:uncharacterized protein (TIGR02271 family)
VASIRDRLVENVQIAKKIETDHVTITQPVRTEDVEITKVAGKPAANLGLVSGQASSGAQGAANLENLKLAQEQLVVGKREVDNGGVRLVKVVRTQEASQPLDLKREEYTINRTPLGDQPINNTDFNQREIRMNLTREEPVVGTRNYLTEVVRVRKQLLTDNQTVTGAVRKESVEIVKLAADQSAQGGTSISSQSGTGYMSGSSDAMDNKETTITGDCLCAKCQLKKTAACQNAIQVKDGTKTLTYYLVANDVSKNFHENVCMESKKVTANGTVKEVDGKIEFTATKMELVK